MDDRLAPIQSLNSNESTSHLPVSGCLLANIVSCSLSKSRSESQSNSFRRFSSENEVKTNLLSSTESDVEYLTFLLLSLDFLLRAKSLIFHDVGSANHNFDVIPKPGTKSIEIFLEWLPCYPKEYAERHPA